MKFNLYKYNFILLFVLMLACVSCRKAVTSPDGSSGSTTTTKTVTLQFTATAADTSATLNVKIYDNNSGHIYYNATTPKNSYSGQTGIAEGSTVTFAVTSSVNTNISSQITDGTKAVAIGNYNQAQQQGLSPAVTLYYKVP